MNIEQLTKVKKCKLIGLKGKQFTTAPLVSLTDVQRNEQTDSKTVRSVGRCICLSSVVLSAGQVRQTALSYLNTLDQNTTDVELKVRYTIRQ